MYESVFRKVFAHYQEFYSEIECWIAWQNHQIDVNCSVHYIRQCCNCAANHAVNSSHAEKIERYINENKSMNFACMIYFNLSWI